MLGIRERDCERTSPVVRPFIEGDAMKVRFSGKGALGMPVEAHAAHVLPDGLCEALLGKWSACVSDELEGDPHDVVRNYHMAMGAPSGGPKVGRRRSSATRQGWSEGIW